jgi:hypothetical protein
MHPLALRSAYRNFVPIRSQVVAPGCFRRSANISTSRRAGRDDRGLAQPETPFSGLWRCSSSLVPPEGSAGPNVRASGKSGRR